MLAKEDFESWNELFPDCKINEADLTNPTQPFVTKVLMAYLRKFGYEEESSLAFIAEASENTRDRIAFLAKLTQRVQYILQITDPSYTFYYFDLIRPTHKKISHTLGILLNHLYYFNMYKTDVFAMVNERIKLRQELRTRIEQLTENNEQQKRHAEELKENIAKLTEQMLIKTAGVKKLTEQKTQLTAELQSQMDSDKQLESQLHALKKQEITLKSQIVTKAEACDLQTQLSKLQKSLDENNQLICATENQIKEAEEQINTMDDLLLSVKATKDVIPRELLANYTALNQKLEATSKHLATVEQTKKDILQQLSAQQSELNACHTNLAHVKATFEAKMLSKKQLLESVVAFVKAKRKERNALRTQEIVLKCEIEQQLDIEIYLREHLTMILRKPSSQIREEYPELKIQTGR